MRNSRIFTILTALILAAQVPVDSFAKGSSGFSSGGARSSFGSSSSRSSFSSSSYNSSSARSNGASSPAPVRSSNSANGKSASGFGSSAPKAPAYAVPATATALGASLYAAHANKAAVEANTASTHGTSTASGSAVASNAPTRSATNTASVPTYAPVNRTAGAPAPTTVVHHYESSGSSSNPWLWYMIGRDAARPAQPVTYMPAPGTSSALPVAPGSAREGAEATASSVNPADSPESSHFLRNLVVILALAGLGYFAWWAWRQHQARVARLMPKTNYEL